ncbi:extra-large guanine nucleotide-binding protein 3-like [Nymphaea colorata]|nr:extra-large guanine nucleotide-binding protein 3-like [Nymphaea colorata]
MADMVSQKSWEEFLRKMLPPGAILPDYDHLDYSIALEYEGPPLACDLPQVAPVDLRFVSVTLPASPTVDSSLPVPVVEPLPLRVTRFNRSNRAHCQPIDANQATPPPRKPRDRRSDDSTPAVPCNVRKVGNGVIGSNDRDAKNSDAVTPQLASDDRDHKVSNHLPTSSASSYGVSSSDCKSAAPETGDSCNGTVLSERVSHDLESSDDVSAIAASISCSVGLKNICKSGLEPEDSDRRTVLSEPEENCAVSSLKGIGSSSLPDSGTDCSSHHSQSMGVEAKIPHEASVSETKDDENSSDHVGPSNLRASIPGHSEEVEMEASDKAISTRNSDDEHESALGSKRLHSVVSSPSSVDERTSLPLCPPAASTSSPSNRMNQRANRRRRVMPVTFDTMDDSEVDDSEFSLSRTVDSSSHEFTDGGSRHRGVLCKPRKKHICSRCGRGVFFKGTLSCLACGAGYCGNCVLRAMGSMPEGRKCITCIGQPIDESKRSRLGRPSRLLHQLYCPLEIKQIMKAEIECPSNQLRSEQIIVNDRPLSREELAELQGCPIPPRRLKPGRYWYDKDSGFWGKEGRKPDMIISSKLTIGGKLQAKASNGNTEVYFNGREITKEERKVLQWAKIQCPPGTIFWLSDDGSIVEEGQKNLRGKIWEKAQTRLLCSLLSLPVPHVKTAKDASIFPRPVPKYLEERKTQRLLLLGPQGSGTTTIFKQAKYLFDTFSQEALVDMKFLIQSDIYKYLGVLFEARERFEEEFFFENQTASQDHLGGDEAIKISSLYSLNTRLKHFSDWLLDTISTGNFDAFFPAASREHASSLVDAWNDPAIQETYKRKDEVHALPDVANYFLDKAMEISRNDYEPSEMDILYADGLSLGDGLASMDFLLEDKSQISVSLDGNHESSSPLTKYQLIRLNSNALGEGCKWLEMFEDMRAVIFCVSLSDYDQVVAAGNSSPPQNKMLLSKELFECMVRHSSFEDTPFVLVLNKFDVFEGKINTVPLTVCEWFKDFRPVRSSYAKVANQAYFYVAKQFKSLYSEHSNRKLFVWQGNARQRSNIDEAFKFIKEVLRWHDEKDNSHYIAEDSQYSTEATSMPCVTQE